MSSYRGKIVYIEGPKFKRSGQVLSGFHYGVDWIDGYAGPFYYSGPQFNQIMAKLPARCNIIVEDEFYVTDPGKVRLRQREVMLNRKTEAMSRDDMKVVVDAKATLAALEDRYVEMDYYGLVGIAKDLVDDIRLSVKIKTDNQSEHMSQHGARRRVLKHVGNHGWDRGRFDSGNSIKKEWTTFYSEVLLHLLDGKGNLLPYRAPVRDELESEESILYG